MSFMFTRKYQPNILVGDCLNILAGKPEQSVHCCVTSPPYYGQRDYGHTGQIGLEATPVEYVQNLVAVFRQVRRVLRDDGTLWLNLGDSFVNNPSSAVNRNGLTGKLNNGKTEFDCRAGTRGDQQRKSIPDGMKVKDLMGIPWMVAFALRADGWYLRSDIIWNKTNPMPDGVKDRPTKAHEYIFLLSKTDKYYYDHKAVREPTQGNNGFRNRRSVWTIDEADEAVREPMQEDDSFCDRRSVWTIATGSFKGAHFATFPPDLIEPCIKAGSPEDGMVLDPFGGAGTTALVSERLGRHSTIIEINPDYAAIARIRLGIESVPICAITDNSIILPSGAP